MQTVDDNLKSALAAAARQLPRARAALMPNSFSPMLASPVEGSFPGRGWIFEPKLDGMRAIAVVRSGKCTLFSRRGLHITNQYPSLAAEIGRLCHGDMILDGEIIALDRSGHPSFQELQQRMNVTRASDIGKLEKRIPVFYFAFDIAYCGDTDLTGVPLRLRKEFLCNALEVSETVRLLEHFMEDGEGAYDACIQNGFEGIVAKRLESQYECGRRSPSWIKVKAQKTADLVVAGFTPGQGSRSAYFGALLLGHYNSEGKLIYAGSVGTGFDGKLLQSLTSAITPLQTTKCSFFEKATGQARCDMAQTRARCRSEIHGCYS